MEEILEDKDKNLPLNNPTETVSLKGFQSWINYGVISVVKQFAKTELRLGAVYC